MSCAFTSLQMTSGPVLKDFKIPCAHFHELVVPMCEPATSSEELTNKDLFACTLSHMQVHSSMELDLFASFAEAGVQLFKNSCQNGTPDLTFLNQVSGTLWTYQFEIPASQNLKNPMIELVNEWKTCLVSIQNISHQGALQLLQHIIDFLVPLLTHFQININGAGFNLTQITKACLFTSEDNYAEHESAAKKVLSDSNIPQDVRKRLANGFVANLKRNFPGKASDFASAMFPIIMKEFGSEALALVAKYSKSLESAQPSS